MIKGINERYDTIIFDMDGVITSEENYWNTAALTVYEYINGVSEDDTARLSKNARAVRDIVFCGGRTISALKNKGVNSNWDLGYVVYLIMKILGTTDYEQALEYTNGLNDNMLTEYGTLAAKAAAVNGEPTEYYERNGELWRDMQSCFQEWYLGEEKFTKTYGSKPRVSGKTGLILDESPIVDLTELKRVLTDLGKHHRLCIGTGRPFNELDTPLVSWGIFEMFDRCGICTYDAVENAERELGVTITKPHPYTFLKALYGTDYPDSDIINGNYDRTRIERTLVVGDAGADILAAHNMGADFCAVLTGVDGEKARRYFEQLNAEFILDNVCDMI